MAGPTLRLEAPTRADRLGGLSHVAEFIERNEIGVAEDFVFQSEGCAFPQLEAARCFVEDVPDKQFGGIFVNNSITDLFTIYAGVRCFAGPESDHEERASRALRDGRDRVLESQLGLWLAGATVLAAGGTVTGALAEVEQALDSQYVGRGVIVMSRADAIRAHSTGGLVPGPNGTAHTINGTPVLASGMIASGQVHGTGAITVTHTSTFNRDVIVHRKNLHDALAEAQFVISVDCEFRVKSSTGA